MEKKPLILTITQKNINPNGKTTPHFFCTAMSAENFHFKILNVCLNLKMTCDLS